MDGWNNNEGDVFMFGVTGRLEAAAGGDGRGARAQDPREAESRGRRRQQGSEEGKKHINLVGSVGKAI